MSRNYGLGTRNMAQAGRIALSKACSKGELSYASVDAISDRWAQFAAYAKAHGVGRMERVSAGLVIQWGLGLADHVREGQMTPAYAQNMVSAVNSVMHQVRDWHSVSPTRECQIQQRSSVRATPPPGIERSGLSRALDVLRAGGQVRGAVIAELARDLGLRSKEASLINAHAALREARNKGVVTILEGTKGGRARVVPILAHTQLQALQRAASVQGQARSLVPAHQSWAQWRNGGLRDTRETLQAHGIDRLHDLRAAYACHRYHSLTGQLAPVLGGQIQNRKADHQARQVISQELGHGRIEVVAAYIGGR